MDRHDAHRVFALVGAQLHTIDVVDAPVDPRQVLGQRATGGVAPRPSLVDHVANPTPRLPGHLLPFGQRRGNAAPLVVELGDQFRRRALVLAPAELVDRPQSVADDAGLFGEDTEVLRERVPAQSGGPRRWCINCRSSSPKIDVRNAVTTLSWLVGSSIARSTRSNS